MVVLYEPHSRVYNYFRSTNVLVLTAFVICYNMMRVSSIMLNAIKKEYKNDWLSTIEKRYSYGL